MIVYYSTVVRGSPLEQGGELVKLDWQSKAVLARTPIIPTHPAINDQNPRGGTRGGRGILVREREVFAASYHSIHVFDRDLKPVRQISHPHFSNIHELAWQEDDIWVTSTTVDAAIKIDLTGAVLQSWWAREDPATVARLRLPQQVASRDLDYRLASTDNNSASGHVHLNAVAILAGHPAMLLNRYGCVISLNPTRILIHEPALKGAHNLAVTREGCLLINNTLGKALDVYDQHGRHLRRIRLTQFDEVQRLLRMHAGAEIGCWLAQHGHPRQFLRRCLRNVVVARPIFVRGLCQTPKGTVLVGISPASLLEIDWQSGKLVDFFGQSTDRHICPHGIACSP